MSSPLPWADRAIDDILAADYRAASVLARLGVDCSRDEPQTLGAACEACGASVAGAASELMALEAEQPRPPLQQSVWDLDLLVLDIVDKHHRYIRDALPALEKRLQDLVGARGNDHPELTAILDCLREFRLEILNHLAKEEHILFPAIVAMAEARRAGQSLPALPFSTIYHPIRAMEGEHVRANELIGMVRALSGDYGPPADASNEWRHCYAHLERFERDLHVHVHLENHLLFPRALELEQLLS